MKLRHWLSVLVSAELSLNDALDSRNTKESDRLRKIADYIRDRIVREFGSKARVNQDNEQLTETNQD